MENINKLGMKEISFQNEVDFMTECFKEEFGNYGDPCFMYKNEDEYIANWRILMLNDKMIGYFKLNRHDDLGFNYIHIPCILMKKEFRKKGYAKKTIDFIKKIGLNNDVKLIELESLKSSELFWIKQDFKVTERNIDENGRELITMKYYF